MKNGMTKHWTDCERLGRTEKQKQTGKNQDRAEPVLNEDAVLSVPVQPIFDTGTSLLPTLFVEPNVYPNETNINETSIREDNMCFPHTDL